MVGRLVEDRQIGPLGQDPRQRHASALPAAQLLDDRLRVTDPQPIQQRLRLVHPLPPAQALDLAGRRALLPDQTLHLLRRQAPALERLAGREVPRPGLRPPAEPRQHRLERAHPRREVRLLLEVRDRSAAALHDLAAVRRVEPGEDPHERALPRAVHADEAHTLAGVDREADVLEDAAGSEAAGDVLGSDDRQGARIVRARLACKRYVPPPRAPPTPRARVPTSAPGPRSPLAARSPAPAAPAAHAAAPRICPKHHPRRARPNGFCLPRTVDSARDH
jgi:hypothetical protein